MKCNEISKKEYDKIHRWLRRVYGHAKICEICKGLKGNKRYEYALKREGMYCYDRSSYLTLCRICHLEYDGIKTNILHKLRTIETMEKIHKAKCQPIAQYDRNMNFIKQWRSQTEAAKAIGISKTTLHESLSGQIPTAGGFKWSRI